MSSKRLATATLGDFSALHVPDYDRARVGRSIVHLGTGAFHRAHQAVYTDDILADDPRWGILGTSLRSGRVREQLVAQDFLYTVCTRAPGAERYRAIGAIQDVLTLADHRDRIVAAIASPDVQVVTLTVTEKGYCHRADGTLDETHPHIAHDLSKPNAPLSAPGVLVAGLAERRRRDSGPVTLLSCDNLAGNGRVLRQVVRGLAELADAGLADWCDRQVTFPSSMVDRIVPATTDADRERCAAATGRLDAGLVVSEPFGQWVIEDCFAGDRPPWDRCGAQFVEDVGPFEQAKLRLLNATHSALAYLGLLTGHAFIHEAMDDARLSEFAASLMDDEISPLIEPPQGLDLDAYKADILSRFANSAIAYGTAQVAADGSKKLPERIFPTIVERRRAGLDSPHLCLVVAAWLRCMREPRLAMQFPDPNHERVRAQPEQGLIRSLASRTDVLAGLGEYPEIVQSIEQAYSALARPVRE